MKHVFHILIPIILCGGCNPNDKGKNSSAPVAYDDGKILVDTTDFNFGIIDKSDCNFVRFHFWIANISSDTVFIETVDPSCTCIKIDRYERSIKPDGNWKLSGRVETSRYSGKFNKPLFVKSSNGVVLLRIKGEIK